MKLLTRNYDTPQENLACDELLLELCDTADGPETLRLWEPRHPFLVLGYSNRIETEVHRRAARARRVSILRRLSGGGAVLQGPGCLNYSLILRLEGRPQLRTIASANTFILGRHRRLLEELLARPVQIRGATDLALGELKFSGNAQRRGRRALLFHGTFLLGLELALMERLLPIPSRQPHYRRNRPHGEFLTRLPLPAPTLKEGLARCWAASEPAELPPGERLAELVRTRYSSSTWTNKF